ncbi:ArsC family transcriptional regulator, partial [Campylobacter jejuni]
MDALTQKGIVFDFMDIKKINQDILYTWLKQKSFEELI